MPTKIAGSSREFAAIPEDAQPTGKMLEPVGIEPAYDIIGDVHGQLKLLEALLEGMGYRHNGVAWRHPERQAIFVGDVIDKGPDPGATLTAVRAMVDAGAARMVVGNHELNWIAATWRLLDQPKAFLEATRKHPCRARLADSFGNDTETLVDLLIWLQQQPIWIDEPNIRVVHASWHTASIQHLKRTGMVRLDAGAMAQYESRYSPTHLALDRIVAGAEHTFDTDAARDGYRSLRRRVRWWPGNDWEIHSRELVPHDAADIGYPEDAPPVFIGHYALTGEPRPLAANVIGIDYAAAYGGPLVAYRHDGRLRPQASNFVIQTLCGHRLALSPRLRSGPVAPLD